MYWPLDNLQCFVFLRLSIAFEHGPNVFHPMRIWETKLKLRQLIYKNALLSGC